MQLFQKTTSNAVNPQILAGVVLDTIPLVMGMVRTSMRANRGTTLSIPQFRSLALIYHCQDISLSEIAEHVGMSLPTASKLIDGLVLRGLLSRTESPNDRRKKQIRITPAGRECFNRIREHARQALAEKLTELPPPDAAVIRRAMLMLQKHLAGGVLGNHSEKSV